MYGSGRTFYERGSGSNHAAPVLQSLKTAPITLNVIGCELWWLTRRVEDSLAARAKILSSCGLAPVLSQMESRELADDRGRGSLASLGGEPARKRGINNSLFAACLSLLHTTKVGKLAHSCSLTGIMNQSTPRGPHYRVIHTLLGG